MIKGKDDKEPGCIKSLAMIAAIMVFIYMCADIVLFNGIALLIHLALLCLCIEIAETL